MASTYSPLLALELIGSGDQAGTWGLTTNNNLGTLVEQAIAGYVTQAITDGADTTITIPSGLTGVARNMYLELTGALTADRNLIVPTNHKLYFIFNNTTGGHAVTVKVSAGVGVSVPNGRRVLLVLSGVSNDIVEALNTITGTLNLSALTVSTALALDASKNVVSVTNTGTGNNVLATNPALTTPDLGTPSAVVLTNATGTATGLTAGAATLAASATKLATARAINGVNFDGTAAITVTAAAGTLTGATLAAGVTASSLTSLGTIAALNAGTGAFSGQVTLSSPSGIVAGGTTTGAAFLSNSDLSSNVAVFGPTHATKAFFVESIVNGVVISSNRPTGIAVKALLDDAGNLIVSSTNPTIASGFGTNPSIGANNTAAFTVTVGNPAGGQGTLTLPAAPNGWACSVQNATTAAADTIIRSTSTSTTQVVITNIRVSTAAQLNWQAGDVLQIMCHAF